MNELVRVLVVDDSEDDALLLGDELRDGGYALTSLRVDTPQAMREALRDQTWDIIIADYTMPGFSGPEALEILHESGLDIPLILVSGTAEEHTGIDMMLAGASDFIVKHSLSRLVPAVARELRQAESRRQRRRSDEAAKASAENYRTMFEHTPAAIVSYDREGIVLQVNPVFEQMYGYSREEVIGRHIADVFGRPEDAEALQELTARVFACEAITNTEWQDTRKDGTTIHVLANVTPVCDDLGEITMALVMMTDITESKLAEEHKRDFYRRTISAFTGGKLVIVEPEEIMQAAGDAVGFWNLYALEDLNTMRGGVKDLLLDAGMDERRLYEFMGAIVEAATNAYKHAGGGRVSLHLNPSTVVCVVSDTGPGMEALALPDVALTKGYSTANTLGMGYKIMIQSADRTYLATSTKGTTVAVEMAINPGPPERDALLEKLTSRLSEESLDDP